jgi:prepilin-type N-terminal cleavage/methylation domain-containing protein
MHNNRNNTFTKATFAQTSSAYSSLVVYQQTQPPQRRYRSAFTLVEVLVAMMVLAFAALGAMAYEYYAATHERAALAKLTATRTAQLLIDDWKSAGGSTSYTPGNLNLGFTDADDGTGNYTVNVDKLPMYIELSSSDIEYDSEAEVTLRKITVTVNYLDNRRTPSGQNSEKDMVLSTYVRVDASSG